MAAPDSAVNDKEALEPLPWAWALVSSVVHVPEMLIMSHATCFQSVCRCNFTMYHILRQEPSPPASASLGASHDPKSVD